MNAAHTFDGKIPPRCTAGRPGRRWANPNHIIYPSVGRKSYTLAWAGAPHRLMACANGAECARRAGRR